MKLPDGVTYNPGMVKRWIALDQEAFITINTRRYPPNAHYKVNDRDFERDFKELFSDDYRNFDQRYHLLGDRKGRRPVYSGAQHGSDAQLPEPKLPNITVVPNVSTSLARTVGLRFERKDVSGHPIKNGKGKTICDDFQMPTGQEVTLFGCTMGHWHEEANCTDGVQEVYEFQSYGALLIDRPESAEVELWVARDGDKVVVPQQCHMTLYNLDDTDHPLITLDFAHPQRNHSNKELVQRIGPILMGYYTAHEAVFVLNAQYVNRQSEEFRDPTRYGSEAPDHSERDNRQCLHGGVRVSEAITSREGREVRVPLGTRSGLGQQLYEALTGNEEVIVKFARLGIRVRRASPDVCIGGTWIGRPLVEAVKAHAWLYRYFVQSTSPSESGTIPAAKRRLDTGEKQWSGTGPRMLEPGRKEGDIASLAIPILIEGAGEWVDKAFIPALKPYLDKEDGPYLTVTIADDSRWHSPEGVRPMLPPAHLYPNIAEVIKQQKVKFFDKADRRDYLAYREWLASIVFVVTPDYTHSMLCCDHLDRALTIFVEKPFDANYDNVRQLLQARGLAELDTEVYALDHYRFYAWRLKESSSGRNTLLEEATDWLGGALRRARFCMTESRPVEPNRVRALQYGLMLDMLPHCFAMLAFFGKLDSIDELRLVSVGRYLGAPIARETFAHVEFTFEDYSDNGWRVPCEAWIGKGLKKDRKFFEVEGVSGKSVLIVLGPKTHWWTSKDEEVDGGIHFVDGNGKPVKKAELDTERYKQLIADLVEGTRKAIICAMPLRAGVQIVRSLGRLWDAIQSHSPWRPYEVGEVDCFEI